jgi:hypothetical protein
MVGFKKTKSGWVAIMYYLGYDDEYHSTSSPPFRTQLEAEKYAIEELGARKCDFCKHVASYHFNMSGQNLQFDSESLYGDYFTCLTCIPKVKEDIAWRRTELEERLKAKYGQKSNRMNQSRQPKPKKKSVKKVK